MAENTPADGETPDATAPVDELAGLKSALEKERDARKAAEKDAKRARDLETELAKLRETSLTDAEKALDAARREADQAARAEVTSAFAQRIAAAEIRAALTGVVKSPDAIVEDLNLAKFVTDTGDVDAEAVTRLREKFAAEAQGQPARPRGDADQGPRGSAALALNSDPLRESVEAILGNR